jgi:septal ring factor EnvC (AmiA/AmiB activator)
MVSAIFTFLLFLSEQGLAQNTELESLRALVKGMEQQLQQALQRIDQLEKEKGSTVSRVDQVERSVKAVQSAPSALNPAIGMAIDATAEQRSKTGGNLFPLARSVSRRRSILTRAVTHLQRQRRRCGGCGGGDGDDILP